MFYFIFGTAGIIILASCVKTRHFMAAMIFSVLQGLISLFAVNYIGSFIDVHINFNVFSGIVSSIGGLPGVIMLLLFDIVL